MSTLGSLLWWLRPLQDPLEQVRQSTAPIDEIFNETLHSFQALTDALFAPTDGPDSFAGEVADTFKASMRDYLAGEYALANRHLLEDVAAACESTASAMTCSAENAVFQITSDAALEEFLNTDAGTVIREGSFTLSRPTVLPSLAGGAQEAQAWDSSMDALERMVQEINRAVQNWQSRLYELGYQPLPALPAQDSIWPTVVKKGQTGGEVLHEVIDIILANKILSKEEQLKVLKVEKIAKEQVLEEKEKGLALLKLVSTEGQKIPGQTLRSLDLLRADNTFRNMIQQFNSDIQTLLKKISHNEEAQKALEEAIKPLEKWDKVLLGLGGFLAIFGGVYDWWTEDKDHNLWRLPGYLIGNLIVLLITRNPVGAAIMVPLQSISLVGPGEAWAQDRLADLVGGSVGKELHGLTEDLSDSASGVEPSRPFNDIGQLIVDLSLPPSPFQSNVGFLPSQQEEQQNLESDWSKLGGDLKDFGLSLTEFEGTLTTIEAEDALTVVLPPQAPTEHILQWINKASHQTNQLLNSWKSSKN